MRPPTQIRTEDADPRSSRSRGVAVGGREKRVRRGAARLTGRRTDPHHQSSWPARRTDSESLGIPPAAARQVWGRVVLQSRRQNPVTVSRRKLGRSRRLHQAGWRYQHRSEHVADPTHRDMSGDVRGYRTRGKGGAGGAVRPVLLENHSPDCLGGVTLVQGDVPSEGIDFAFRDPRPPNHVEWGTDQKEQQRPVDGRGRPLRRPEDHSSRMGVGRAQR